MRVPQLKAWIGAGFSLLLLVLVGGAAVWYTPSHIRIESYPNLGFSLLLLSLGMVCQYLLWHLLVVAITGSLPLRVSFCSHALMIWGKYVPGKIWSVVGRAGFLARSADRSLPLLVGVSSGAQVIMIVTGLACGLSFLALVGGDRALLSAMQVELVAVIVAVAGTVLIGYLYWRLPGSKRNYRRLLVAVLMSATAWLAWGAGLAQLSRAFGLGGDYWQHIGSFATAASAGILAVVSPGGLGVREGTLSLLLSMHGMTTGSAALLALLARIWFVFGELLLFLAGIGFWRGRIRTPT